MDYFSVFVTERKLYMQEKKLSQIAKDLAELSELV
jgi:hypothetical protein